VEYLPRLPDPPALKYRNWARSRAYEAALSVLKPLRCARIVQLVIFIFDRNVTDSNGFMIAGGIDREAIEEFIFDPLRTTQLHEGNDSDKALLSTARY
jgi:hypothetical protein